MLRTLVLLLISCSAYAYQVRPLIVNFSSQSDLRKTIDIINDSNEAIAIEVSVARREISKAGKENLISNSEVDKNFAVYPSQVVVGANSTRTVQLQYLGGNVRSEQAYRFIVEEVNVDFEKPIRKKIEGKVAFLVRYDVSAYVTPKGVKSNLKVKNISKEQDFLLLEIVNNGKKHELLRRPKLIIGKNVVWSSEELKKMRGANILAGNVRAFKLPWPKGKKISDLKKLEIIY